MAGTWNERLYGRLGSGEYRLGPDRQLAADDPSLQPPGSSRPKLRPPLPLIHCLLSTLTEAMFAIGHKSHGDRILYSAQLASVCAGQWRYCSCFHPPNPCQISRQETNHRPGMSVHNTLGVMLYFPSTFSSLQGCYQSPSRLRGRRRILYTVYYHMFDGCIMNLTSSAPA